MLHIPEVFCHGQAGQAHPHTGSWGFVHLAEDHGGFGNNAGFGHFVVQIVALTGTLANAGKDGIAVVRGGDVVNQLLNQNGLAHAGAAEQADFAALGIGANQVDDLDAGFQNVGGGLLLLVRGSRAVNGPALAGFGGFLFVDGLTQQVKHPAQALFTHRHPDGRAGVDGLSTPLQTVGGAHGDAAHHIVADVLGNFRHDGLVPKGNLDGRQQLRQSALREADIENRTHNLDDGSCIFGHRIQLLVCFVMHRQ